MSNPSHPYAEQIRALLAVLAGHPWLLSAEVTMDDGTYIRGERYSFGLGVDVYPTGEAVPGIGDHQWDHEVPGRKFATYKTTIDGVTVITYATRR